MNRGKPTGACRQRSTARSVSSQGWIEPVDAEAICQNRSSRSRLLATPHLIDLGSPPFRGALAKLLPDQREALILVGASGFSYEEAAAICESARRSRAGSIVPAGGSWSCSPSTAPTDSGRIKRRVLF